jgi:hypothetical protein
MEFNVSYLLPGCVGRRGLNSQKQVWVAFDKSEGIVKAQNSPAVFSPPGDGQSWLRTEALKRSR